MKRRRAFGLRARLLAALMFTASATLLVAALVLLPSLQERLEDQSRAALRGTIRQSGDDIRNALQKDGNKVGAATADAAEKITRRTSATVVIWDKIPRRVYPTADPEVTPPKEIRTTLRTRQPAGASTEDGTSLALIVTPERRNEFVLQLTQSDTAVARAVEEVRNAFLLAAIIGLGVALILGLALSATLARRLARLRTAARRLAREGPTAPPVPSDDSTDEIGELSRAFSAMQAALRRQEEARRAFVATASHELRTPLTSLQGNFELLAEDLDSGHIDVDDARRQVQAAQTQLERLSRLATELLDLSRLDAEVTLRSEPIELNEVVRAVTAEFELRASDRGTMLDFSEPATAVWSRGDSNAVAQITRILIDNALRFSERGDPVQVATSYNGERALLTVSDHGPGIPPEERAAIFERFQRGSATGDEGGFGLGLAIGRELANRLGGSLTLDDGYTAGARFVLALPIEQPD